MRKATLILSTLLLVHAARAQTPVDMPPVKQLERTNTLGTCEYAPLAREKPFLHKVPANEKVTGSAFDARPYTIGGKKGKYVGWFGVVRGISPPAAGDKTIVLLIEQKYFGGVTDFHLLLFAFPGE